jgi:hypothetical protein
MNVGETHQVFFAIPFDAATKPMYERILKSLKKKFDGSFKYIYGNSSVIEPSPKFLKIHFFKKQNNDLLKQFLSNIKTSDIIVADLTYNNPNVHVELGIAITLNKNILRVSSRNVIEVGSDVRGYEVNHYSNENNLREKIENYLEQFLSIKTLPLSKKAGPLYAIHIRKTEALEHTNGAFPVRYLSSMRDGALRVKFKFISAKSNMDWFGIHFRYGSQNPWATPGYLLYVRKNGMLELAELPNVRLLKRRKYPALRLNQNHILEFTIDGSNLSAYLDNQLNKQLKIKDLNIQSPGNIALGCYRSEITVSKAETVCRDTIEWA